MTKKILIIGASHGIGNALLKELQKDNCEILAWNRTEIEGTGIQYSQVDITSEAPLPAIDGALDGLVYCPGSINLKPFGRINKNDFLAEMEINLFGAIKAIQHALPNLKQAENASVVLFSTVAVQSGMAFHASIAAAKGAVEGLTRSLAAEFAPKIRFNCIAPSLTDTPLAEKLLNTEEKRMNGANRHPLKKTGTAEDMAHMAAFLLGEKTAWVTGQIMHVDGGLNALR